MISSRWLAASWQLRLQPRTRLSAVQGACAVVLLALLNLGMATQPADAAEKLVVTYGPLNATVAIADLETLVNTDQVPGALKFYLGLANLDPAMLRNLLAMELGASANFMHGMLGSESGNQLLTQISEVIHLPPSRPDIQLLKSATQTYSSPVEAENVEALRAALVQASDDRRVTVLEVLQHYPAERVYLNAVKLIQFANSLESDAESGS